MLYFIANGDLPPDLQEAFAEERYQLYDFTLGDMVRGHIYEIPDIYAWEGEANISLYDTRLDGIQGLRFAVEEPHLEDDDYDNDDDDYHEDEDDEEPDEEVPFLGHGLNHFDREDPVSGTTHTVRRQSWSGGDYNELYRPLFVEFARKLGRGINVSVPHYIPVNLHADSERFWVNIWSSPDPNASAVTRMGDSLLGHHNRMRDGAFGPVTEDHFPTLIDTLMDGGRALAQLFDNDLYILFDAVHFSDEHTIAILKDILDWAVGAYNVSPEERAARIEQRRREVAERARRAYMNWVTNRSEATLRNLRQRYDQARQATENALTNHVNAIRNEQELGLQLRAAEGSSDANPERYGKEYDKLMGSPKIKSIDFDPNNQVFIVNTEKLFVTRDNGEVREMGEYRITLTRQGRLNFHNNTRRVDAFERQMHHPHVFHDGRACLGNFSEIVAPLAAQYEYGTLMLMAINYLESVNERDPAGAKVTSWPLVKKDQAETAEGVTV